MEVSSSFVFLGRDKTPQETRSEITNLHKYVGEALNSKKKGLTKSYNQLLAVSVLFFVLISCRN
jgi:hypothetical protein